MSEDRKNPPGTGLVGLAVAGLCLVGVVSTLAVYGALATENDFTGAGVLAIAAALSFGFLLNGMTRS